MNDLVGPPLDWVCQAVQQLNAQYPRPGHAPLDLSDPYVLRRDWPSTYPWAGNPGVYLFFDGDDRLLYVGKASCSAVLGTRLGAYLQRDPPQTGTGYSWKVPAYAATETIRVIALEPGHAFEAPAVEEFLIGELGPPLNERCRRG